MFHLMPHIGRHKVIVCKTLHRNDLSYSHRCCLLQHNGISHPYYTGNWVSVVARYEDYKDSFNQDHRDFSRFV